MEISIPLRFRSLSEAETAEVANMLLESVELLTELEFELKVMNRHLDRRWRKARNMLESAGLRAISAFRMLLDTGEAETELREVRLV